MPILLLCILFFNATTPQEDISYYGKKKIRTNDGYISKTWNLTLKRDKSFEYVISGTNRSVKEKTGTHYSNKYSGFWQFYNDTLYLHSSALTEYCKKEVLYIKKKESLLPMGACIDSIGDIRNKILRRVLRN